MTPSLGSALSNRSKQKTIPAVVIDVLGNRCSVRLSGRGTKLTGLEFVGSVPKIGDLVIVDYRSANTPMVLTSGSVVTAAPQPITAAVVNSGNSNPAETTPGNTLDWPPSDGQQYIARDGDWSVVEFPADTDIEWPPSDGNNYMVRNGTWVIVPTGSSGFMQVSDDLSSKVGFGNHFMLSTFAESILVSVNGLIQKITDVILDDDSMGFSFSGVVNIGDEFIARYETNMDNVLTDDAGHMLYDSANQILFS